MARGIKMTIEDKFTAQERKEIAEQAATMAYGLVQQYQFGRGSGAFDFLYRKSLEVIEQHYLERKQPQGQLALKLE